MIINCNNLCRKSGDVTEGSLDLDDNKVYCTKCNDELTSVSEFAKEVMKRNKDVIKKSTPKAFTFKCISCNKMVETNIVNGTPVGKYCETKNCSINISQIMVNAMEKMKQVPMNDEKELKMSKFATEVDWNDPEEVDWNDPEAAKEKRQSDFMRLKEGENVVRVMSNPMKTFFHWVTTSDGSRIKINSPVGSPGLVKQLEEAGYKLQANYIIKVLDRSDDKFKLLEVGPQTFKGIQMLNLSPRWGKVTAYDISITKGPKGTQPLYRVTPNPKEKLDASLSSGFEDFNDRVDLTKITATLPDNEINKMLGWSNLENKTSTITYENAIIQIMLELNEDKSILDGYKKLYPSKFSDK